MIAQQIRQFDMLRRVRQFLDDFAARLGALNASGARKQFDQLVEEMGLCESTQASSTLNAKGQTAVQAVLRRDLVKHHMRPVATIAAAQVQSALEDDPKALAAWKSAKRIGRGKGVPIEAIVQPPTTLPTLAETEAKAA